MKKKLVKPFKLTKNFLELIDLKKVKCFKGTVTCSFRHPEDSSYNFLTVGCGSDDKRYKEIRKNAKICISINLECNTCSKCFYNQKNILNVYKLRKKVLSHEDV